VSRVSRVPYHQNVYDLLQIEPGVLPEAARMIAEYEAKYEPLPASVREWYLVPNAVDLLDDFVLGTLWQSYSGGNWPQSLGEVLRQFAEMSYNPTFGCVYVMGTPYRGCRWWLVVNGSDDPSVWNDSGDPMTQVASRFSDFVSDWIGQHYWQRWRAKLQADSSGPYAIHANGLWLRTPDEPFHPPVIDFLIERFGEPEVRPCEGNVSTYTFHLPGGTIRITADEPTLAGGLSAWWVHADRRERLAEFARLLFPWGTLRETLRADTDPAREVLQSLRS
jgi:hypothetical protein